jgi:ribosomal protein L11 methyltransferase
VDVVVRWLVPPSQVELATLELWDRGATAVQEDGAVLLASFPTPAAAAAVASELGATVEQVDPRWAVAWRDHAEPVAIGDRLVVAPAWRPVPVGGGRLVLEIDPGRCFGSGSHPSTRLALTLLAEAPIPPAVLDVGTGSGILAVAAARLGADQVSALDVDPDALVAVAANAARNGVSERVTAMTTPLEQLDLSVDLAVVNVTAAVHAELGAEVVARVRPGGRLILAGMLPGQWDHVAPSYAGAELVELRHLDGWVGATLRRLAGPQHPTGAVAPASGTRPE